MRTAGHERTGLRWFVLVPLAGMLFAMVLVFVARVWRLEIPFERDEGEYAYMGQLMLQGIPPYGIAGNMKLPGTYAAYAVAMRLFGESIRGVHIGYLLVNAAGIVLLFFVGRRWLGAIAGVAAAASYAVLSTSAAVDGFWAHATHFVVLFALAGTLVLMRWADRPKTATLFAGGLLYGLAFLMKQPGILFAAFGAVYIFLRGGKRLRRVLRDLAVFSLAAALPLAVTCLWIWHAGVFSNFWFWVFRYAAQYVSSTTLAGGARNLIEHGGPLVAENPVLILAAAVGLFVLWARRELHAPAVAITLFLVFSWLAVCPGLYFRPHYFVLVSPAIALLIGALARVAGPKVTGSLPLWAIAFGLALSLWLQRGYFLRFSLDDTVRSVYGASPFAEAIPVAGYIRAHTAASDRIAVLGSEPEIYFYSGRKSATPYLYVHPMVQENPLGPRMEEEFVDDMEAWRPKYVVFVNSPDSWGITSGRVPALMEWARTYCDQYYERAGVADIGDDGTVYRWDQGAAGYRIVSGWYVLVLKRK